MKFAEVPWGILPILPTRFSTLHTKTTFVALAHFRDEPIVRLVRLKSTREIHLVNLLALEVTKEGLCGYTVLESRYDPIDCEGTTSSPSWSLRGSGWYGAAGFFPGLSYLLSSGIGIPRRRSGWEGTARLVPGGQMVRNGTLNGA